MKKFYIALALCLFMCSATALAATMNSEPEVIVNSKYYFSFQVPDSWSNSYSLKANKLNVTGLQYEFIFSAKPSGRTLLTVTVADRDYLAKNKGSHGKLFGYNEQYSYFIKPSAQTNDSSFNALLKEIDNIKDYLTILPAPVKGYYVNKDYGFSINLPEVWQNAGLAFVDVPSNGDGKVYSLVVKYSGKGSLVDLFSISVVDKHDREEDNYGTYLGQNEIYAFYYAKGSSSVPADIAKPLSNIDDLFSDRYISSPIGCGILADLVPLYTDAVIFDGISFLPLRAVCEAFSFDVKWENGSIGVSGNDHFASINVGSIEYIANGKQKTLPAAPFIHADITYVPDTFFIEAFNLRVITTVAGEFIVEYK